MGRVKKALKSVIIAGVIFIFISILFFVHTISSPSYWCGQWLFLYRSQLNDFFGKGNWSCVSKKTCRFLFQSDTDYDDDDDTFDPWDHFQDDYQNWELQFLNRNNEMQTCSISNRDYKLSYSHLSAKQALTQELMRVSFALASDEVKAYLVDGVLSENEAKCIEVGMAYEEFGFYQISLKPESYDDLRKEDWFNIKDVSAERYLASEQYDVYLAIHIDGAGTIFELRSEEEQKHIMDSVDIFVEKLLRKYGEHASFVISMDAGSITYENGKKVVE